MTRTRTRAGLALLTTCAVLSAAVSARSEDVRVRIRGTIEAFQGNTMTVKPMTGAITVVDVPDAAPVATTKAFTLADVKPDMVLGVTTIKRADGATIAVEVHPIPASAPQGLVPWDLAPDSVMTNGSVDAVVAGADGQELTLNYKTGTVKVLVLPQTAMSQAAPGTRADIAVGSRVFVFGTKDQAGKITAARIQVGKDGVNPSQ